jgi:hypothetical protein
MDGGGSGAASVWLASAGSDDLRSVFIYLGFDAGAETPGQLLATAEWAALGRPHRLDRALRRLLDGLPHPVRAPVPFDLDIFRRQPDVCVSDSAQLPAYRHLQAAGMGPQPWAARSELRFAAVMLSLGAIRCSSRLPIQRRRLFGAEIKS